MLFICVFLVKVKYLKFSWKDTRPIHVNVSVSPFLGRKCSHWYIWRQLLLSVCFIILSFFLAFHYLSRHWATYNRENRTMKWYAWYQKCIFDHLVSVSILLCWLSRPDLPCAALKEGWKRCWRSSFGVQSERRHFHWGTRVRFLAPNWWSWVPIQALIYCRQCLRLLQCLEILFDRLLSSETLDQWWTCFQCLSFRSEDLWAWTVAWKSIILNLSLCGFIPR